MSNLENSPTVTRRWLSLGIVLATLFVCSAPLSAQVSVGDDLKLHFGGEFGFNYAGNYGTLGSGHGTGFIGNGDLSGWFYDRRFLNFDIRPYYNRTQAASTSGSIFNDTGISASANFFSGSRFPGSVSYTKSHGSGNLYGIPGGAGLYSSDSSLRGFVVSWGVLMPNWPTLQFNYSDTSTSSSLVDAASDVSSSGRDFNINSGYRWAGFDLQGTLGVTHQNTTTPAFLETANRVSESTSKYFMVQGIHPLPLSGVLSLSYYKGKYDFDGQNTGTDTFSAGAGLNPTTRLTVNGTFRYTTNLYAQLQRDIFGSSLTPVPTQNDSKSTYANTTATYRIFRGLWANGYVTYLGQSFNHVYDSNTAYGAGATYMNSIPFLGYFRFGFAVVDYYNNYQKNNGLGAFNLDFGLSRKLKGWDVGVNGNYGQNVLANGSWATTSSYDYGGNFQRRFKPTVMWFGSYRATHSALTMIEGSDSSAQTVTTGWTLGPYGVTGTYSKSDGTSVVTGTGTLVPSPLTSLITKDYVLYNSEALGISASATLFHRAGITAAYSTFHGETSALVNSINEGSSYYLRLRYKIRKLVVNGDYRRVEQTISATGRPPRDVNSFSISITRYFNVF